MLNAMRRYKFSQVFGPETQQEDLYKATAEPLVKGLFEGQNSASQPPCLCAHSGRDLPVLPCSFCRARLECAAGVVHVLTAWSLRTCLRVRPHFCLRAHQLRQNLHYSRRQRRECGNSPPRSFDAV